MFGYNPLASRWGRLLAFFGLYLTEGIPLGFCATAIARQMRLGGATPAEVGTFVGALYLPWAWKWAIAPVVDLLWSRRLGKRRGWIVGTQMGMIATLLLLLPVDFNTEIALFTTIVLIHNFFGATQDIAIDALAVDSLDAKERGLANGLMFAGAYTGNAVGGAGVLYLADYLGEFNPTFYFVAGAIGMVTVFIAMQLREEAPPPAPPSEDSWIRIYRDVLEYLRDALRAFFGNRGALIGAVFALLPCGAYGLSLVLISNLSAEFGLSDTQTANISLMTTIISAVFCVVGGALSDRFGRRRMLALYVLGTAIPTIYMAYAMHTHGWIEAVDISQNSRPDVPTALITSFWIAAASFSVFQGLMYGTRTALFMDVCDPKASATQFTAYMALLNLVIAYSATWQGFAIEKWGYPTMLSLDAGVGLIGLTLLPWVKRR